MEAQEGGGVAFGIMPVERESVILRDLPAQGFTAGDGFGVVAHTSRYEPSTEATPSSYPRASPGFSPALSG
jgi:hypothetical protein